MEYVEITLLADGGILEVEGGLEDAEKTLSDAARSGTSRLAWFKEREGESSVGVNPAHVVALRIRESAG